MATIIPPTFAAAPIAADADAAVGADDEGGNGIIEPAVAAVVETEGEGSGEGEGDDGEIIAVVVVVVDAAATLGAVSPSKLGASGMSASSAPTVGSTMPPCCRTSCPDTSPVTTSNSLSVSTDGDRRCR